MSDRLINRPATFGSDTGAGTTVKGSPDYTANLIAAKIASFIDRREGRGR
ncbi:hypothetical protein K6V72_18870 [Ralstonia insidiosa]|jgi:hypothetical protein|nr:MULTISPECIES: hypothetical protein [Ralstonia]EPX94611.1 hypothetical protein C404_27665 [Ralstonia sp. AU12-08]MBY4911083.1 hypothetical protein [Ralstonia insidiosa]